jgi:hypothetical protein
LIYKNSNILDLLKSYYAEMKRKRSSTKSDKVNTAIYELNYEEVEKNFELIDKDYKIPVFVEIDMEAKRIWQDFINPTSLSPRMKRNEKRHQMEQYMIAVSEKNVQMANLVETSGVYKIERKDIGILYNEITGFVRN